MVGSTGACEGEGGMCCGGKVGAEGRRVEREVVSEAAASAAKKEEERMCGEGEAGGGAHCGRPERQYVVSELSDRVKRTFSWYGRPSDSTNPLAPFSSPNVPLHAAQVKHRWWNECPLRGTVTLLP